MIKNYFRSIRFEMMYLCKDFWWFIQHPKKSNFTEIVYHWHKLISEVFHPFRAIWYGIENLYLYFKVIWFDRQWDHYFLFTLLERKLEIKEKFFNSEYPVAMGAKRIARQVKVCKDLCRVIKNGEIEEKLILDFHLEYGHLTYFSECCKMDKDGKELLFEQKSSTYTDKGYHKDVYYDEFRKIMDKAREKEQKYQAALFRIMNKNIQGWWD